MNSTATASTDPQSLAEASAQAMWARDHAAQGLGMRIERMAPGQALMSMPVRQDMLNGHDMCHGGFMFLLADSAFAFACNNRNQLSVALDTSINFTREVRVGDLLTATATEEHNGKSTGLYIIRIVNQEGKLVAQFKGLCYRTDKKLI